MSKELVQELRKWDGIRVCQKAADLIERQAAEIDRLRKLDAEYGEVEAAIIMADPSFDGDSDHASCGERLIASVNRMGAAYRDTLSQ